MRRFLYFILVILPVFLVLSGNGQLRAVEIENGDVPDFSVGLNLSFGSSDIEFEGGVGVENSLKSTMILLEVDVDLFNAVTVGFLAGYDMNRFGDPVVATGLPLSLSLERDSNNSMAFGISVRAEPFYFGKFSVGVNGQFLYVKQFKTEWDIELPIITGTAIEKHYYMKAGLDLLLQYEGLTGITPFIGPNVHFIDGKLDVQEQIGTISAEQQLEYKQKKLLGVCAGARFEPASNLQVEAKVYFISQTAASVQVLYIF